MVNESELIYTQKGMFGNIDIFRRVMDSNEYISYRAGAGYCHSDVCTSNPFVAQAPLSMTVIGELVQPQNVLILGAGLFSNSIQMSRISNKAKITAVDIEDCLYDLGRKFVGIEQYPNISFVIEDARKFVEKENGTYDYIIVDIFKNSYTPFYFLTCEFYNHIYRMLSQHGVLVINTNMPEMKFLENDKFTHPGKILQSTLFHVGFESIYGNDTFNLGILYCYKEKQNYEWKQRLNETYHKPSIDIHIKVALAAIYIKAYEIEDAVKNLEPFHLEKSSAYLNSFQKYIVECCENTEIEDIKNDKQYQTIGAITYKYYKKSLAKMQKGFDIGEIGYYNEILGNLNALNEQYDPLEMMRYIFFHINLDTFLLEDCMDVPYWSYFLALNRVRKNQAKEALKYFDRILI